MMTFHAVNSDAAVKQWQLKLACDTDITVTNNFSANSATRKVILVSASAVFALEFRTSTALVMFQTVYKYRLLESTYGLHAYKKRDQSGRGLRLLQLQQSPAGDVWEECSSTLDMSFYDVNEDPAAQQKQWRLKLTSVVDISVTDEFSVDAATKRFTLDTAAIALEFPSFKALQMFQTEYVYKLFENTWGMYSDKQRDQSGDRIRLFHFQANKGDDTWELCSGDAGISFYDVMKDAVSGQKQWHLRLTFDIDIIVTDHFIVDAADRSFILESATAVYALRSPQQHCRSLQQITVVGCCRKLVSLYPVP